MSSREPFAQIVTQGRCDGPLKLHRMAEDADDASAPIIDPRQYVSGKDLAQLVTAMGDHRATVIEEFDAGEVMGQLMSRVLGAED